MGQPQAKDADGSTGAGQGSAGQGEGFPLPHGLRRFTVPKRQALYVASSPEVLSIKIRNHFANHSSADSRSLCPSLFGRLTPALRRAMITICLGQDHSCQTPDHSHRRLRLLNIHSSSVSRSLLADSGSLLILGQNHSLPHPDHCF